MLKNNISDMDSGPSNVKLGLRVVRGPDWRYGEDVADGLVGTVVEISGQGGSTIPSNCVSVIWDTGLNGRYRTGLENAFDLCAIDNQELGEYYYLNNCEHCNERGFAGYKWSCSVCPDYSLCSPCYMSDNHDTSHPFFRFEPHSAVGHIVLSRNYSIFTNDKKLAIGIFKDSIVSRKQESRWGGSKEIGQVLDVSKGGEISVRWLSGSCSKHRFGQIDLECVQQSYGGYYYKSHLPVVGAKNNPIMGATQINRPHFGRTLPLSFESPAGFGTSLFGRTLPFSFESPAGFGASLFGSKTRIGELDSKVRDVCLRGQASRPTRSPLSWDSGTSASNVSGPGKEDKCHLRFLGAQESDGNAGTIARRGTDDTFPYRGQVSLQSQNGSNMTVELKFSGNVDLTFSESKATRFKVGDCVKIGVEFSELKRLQREHGEIQRNMIKHLSKKGTVYDVLGDGDVMVKFGDDGPFIFNPAALIKRKR